MTVTTDVENYPGFADVIQGPWLMEQMRAQAEHVGTEIVMDQIAKVDLQKRPFRLTEDIVDVPGIGPGTFEQIRDKVVVR
jgi:thioredoxin reductase (NADPH)